MFHVRLDKRSELWSLDLLQLFSFFEIMKLPEHMLSNKPEQALSIVGLFILKTTKNFYFNKLASLLIGTSNKGKDI